MSVLLRFKASRAKDEIKCQYKMAVWETDCIVEPLSWSLCFATVYYNTFALLHPDPSPSIFSNTFAEDWSPLLVQNPVQNWCETEWRTLYLRLWGIRASSCAKAFTICVLGGWNTTPERNPLHRACYLGRQNQNEIGQGWIRVRIMCGVKLLLLNLNALWVSNWVVGFLS